jgi:hypothetical protein
MVAFCSMAVNWHRFILRDELPSVSAALRVDALVLRYLGNSLLALAAGALPMLLVAGIVSILPQTAIILLLPAALAAGTIITILSIKLPAVALGRRDFSFADALRAAEGNFWPILAIFCLNLFVIAAPMLVLAVPVALLRSTNPILSDIVGLLVSAPLNLFLVLFSVSVLTSLYGFFVEGRDF